MANSKKFEDLKRLQRTARPCRAGAPRINIPLNPAPSAELHSDLHELWHRTVALAAFQEHERPLLEAMTYWCDLFQMAGKRGNVAAAKAASGEIRALHKVFFAERSAPEPKKRSALELLRDELAAGRRKTPRPAAKIDPPSAA